MSNVEKLTKDVRVLKIYAGIITILLTIFLFGAFASNKTQKFEEINVERINIVEKDGKLKMVISNKARQHPGIIDGKYFKEREGKRPAGMIFFSEKGDEIGGLTFRGNTGAGQSSSLTFDKFRGDQTVRFFHAENKDGGYFAGIRVNDQNLPLVETMAKMEEINKLPTREAATEALKRMSEKGQAPNRRLILGRAYDKSSFVNLYDARGRSRIAMSVQADGNPTLNFLDEKGKVIYSLPKDAKAKS